MVLEAQDATQGRLGVLSTVHLEPPYQVYFRRILVKTLKEGTKGPKVFSQEWAYTTKLNSISWGTSLYTSKETGIKSTTCSELRPLPQPLLFSVLLMYNSLKQSSQIRLESRWELLKKQKTDTWLPPSTHQTRRRKMGTKDLCVMHQVWGNSLRADLFQAVTHGKWSVLIGILGSNS